MCKNKKQQVKYHVVIHGENSSREICFTKGSTDFKTLSDSVDLLTRNAEVKLPALHEDLVKVREAFELGANRPNSEKVGNLWKPNGLFMD